MQTVILAGGMGTRMTEYTKTIPKPMVKVNGKPILIHIMKIYSNYGYNNFILSLGFKAEIIAKYFLNKKKISLNKLKKGINVKKKLIKLIVILKWFTQEKIL